LVIYRQIRAYSLHSGCAIRLNRKTILSLSLNNLSYKVLFDALADAMLLVDSAGVVVDANPAALLLLEYSKDKLIGLKVEALIPEASHKHHSSYRDVFFKQPSKRAMGSGRDLFALSFNQKQLSVDISLSPITINHEQFVIASLYPSENRQRIENALKASEERFRLARKAAGLGVYDYDLKNGIVHWDERIQEIWGGTPESLSKYKHYKSAIHPEDFPLLETTFRHASNPNGNGAYRLEFRVKNCDNGIETWVSTTGQIHFERNKANRLLGIMQDITEHKLLEKKLLTQSSEREGILKQQIAAHTASAIAHELNQPLAAISAYSEVALHAINDGKSSPDKLKHALEGCVTQAQRAGTSLHELIAFLHDGELITEVFDLNEAVLEALNITKSDGYKEFHPVLHLEKHLPTVKANRIQIEKVLVNLITNAVEAMRGTLGSSSEIIVTVKTNKETNMGHVTIHDSGPGISQEMVRRVFQPFFTTKPTGIGMGLAISRALVEANGGQLWLDPSVKRGATLHFTLPFSS
jgi:two-component system, LuxR family, sensor kinase FixL